MCIKTILRNFFRRELNRLRELDFFRRHVSAYQEMGRTAFASDKDYRTWLRGLKPEEPPLIDLATDDDDTDDKDANKGGRAPKSRDVTNQKETQEMQSNKKGTVAMINKCQIENKQFLVVDVLSKCAYEGEKLLCVFNVLQVNR